VTVRDWFRLVRASTGMGGPKEQELLLAVRQLDWRLVEFWLLERVSAALALPAAHAWREEEYVFECARCGATMPREIDEHDPPTPDPTCHCRSCRPCGESEGGDR
jgi:hypothetical protein